MNFRNLFLMFVSLAAGPAFGEAITLHLDFGAAAVLPGTTVDFTGTITNNTSDYVYMNSIAVDGLPAELSVDTSPFLDGPYPLNPFQTSDDFTFFSVSSPVSYAGPFGALTATVTILGGADSFMTGDFSDNPLGGTSITVVAPALAPAPEPSTLLLLVVGLLLVYAARSKSGARLGRGFGRPARSRATVEPEFQESPSPCDRSVGS
jgi:PEP-CTERM motif